MVDTLRSPYVTKDGSLVRELLHPNMHGNYHENFAETVVPVGKSGVLHR